MSFPRYPNYKDSGVEWLGEVPTHWRTSKLKHAASFFSGGTPSKERLDYWNGDVPWASSKDLKTERLSGTQDHITARAVEDGVQLVSPGDILVVVRGMILAHTFPVAKVMSPMAINQDLKAIRVGPGWSADYFSALLRAASSETFRRLDEAGHGTKALRMEAWLGMELPQPSLAEQEAIAEFLDRETAKIDALVAEQERLIELLKEKRQAVISHAVTKGLNPNAPMKDSGIEWLGQVPAHWEVRYLKSVATVNTGVAKGKDLGGRETISVPYLRVANVQDGYLDLDEVAQIDILPSELKRYELRKGDVLMNEGGDFDKLGRGCVWEEQIRPCITQNHVFAVRPHSVSSSWLSTIIGSSYAQFFFMSRSKQSTNLASISSRNLMELPVLMPPQREQESLLEFVQRERVGATGLLRESERAVAVLQERRAALISAAVTGQIDVRPESLRSAA